VSQQSIQFGPITPLARPRLVLSFSMGKTSGLMTKLCLERLRDQYEMIVMVANTGEEREESLLFGHQCDTQFGFNAVWVEAEVNPEKGEGTRHRVVTYETATRPMTRNGPFEQVIRKYGIPGPGRGHCTRELKANAIASYLRSIGWDDYTIAIGIRPDEDIRVDEAAVRRANQGHKVRFIYPLIDYWYHDKQDVNDWWEEQPFNLQLEEHEGNCAWCWKKHWPKHARLVTERPEVYAFPMLMEELYPRVGPEFEKDLAAPNRVFFRNYTSTKMLAKVAVEMTAQQEDRARLRALAKVKPDDSGGCGEACHPYPMLDLEGG
jgi:3'-phosphoadenosine 5'-phosphosulfate sulfotransferase (PAPS reductase)/FAD synthetase